MSAPATNLGRTQKLVLRLLACHVRPPTVRDLAMDWPGLTESAVRGAIGRLESRRLVDVAGYDGEARTYTLTGRGALVERALNLDDEDER